MALWIGGCPPRHRGTRLVYVPASSPAPTAPPAGELVIEEPPPPPPTEPALGMPSQVPGQEHVPIRTGKAPAVRPPGTTAEGPAAAEQVPDEGPVLQPRHEDPEALRREVVSMQQKMEQRIASLEGNLMASAADRKTREDARAFLVQSRLALEQGDLQRASNLARKGSLLLNALGP